MNIYIDIHMYVHIVAYTPNLTPKLLQHCGLRAVCGLQACAKAKSPLTTDLQNTNYYGVATVSRIDKSICLFCRISSLL